MAFVEWASKANPEDVKQCADDVKQLLTGPDHKFIIHEGEDVRIFIYFLFTHKRDI